MTKPKSVPWAGEKIESRALADLKPFERNAKLHPEDQVKALRAAIDQWGWTMPVLIDEANELIAGHGRVLAAKLPPEIKRAIPVIVARGWSDAQKRAYRIADNKLTELGGWADLNLRFELGAIAATGFDLNLTGFSLGELSDLSVPGFAGIGDGTSEAKVKLSDRFGIPPFSVLNAREGWWQDRKRAWIALGIASELGRGENLLAMSETVLEPDPKKRALKKAERVASTKGNGWANGGPARRDAAFYSKKRAWEKANGKKISTTEFRTQHWDGYQNAEV